MNNEPEVKVLSQGPNRGNLTPRRQGHVGREARRGNDANLYAGLFALGESAGLALSPGRLGYVYLARGQLRVNGLELGPGDAAALSGEAAIKLDAGQDAEVLVFDLAAR